VVDAAIVISVASMARSTYDWQCNLTVEFRTSSQTLEKRNRFGKGETRNLKERMAWLINYREKNRF